MHKIILFFIITFSTINSINAMECNFYEEKKEEYEEKLPSEVLYLIASNLINIEKIRTTQNLNELKSEVRDLFESFAPLSKKHKSIVANMPQQKDYHQRKKVIIEQIREKLKTTYNSFGWFNGINSNDPHGHTALFSASTKEKIELLLENGTDINAKNKFGRTALMIFAEFGHGDFVELLIEKGADINTVDNEGNTALIYAIIADEKEIVELLVINGANTNVLPAKHLISQNVKKILKKYKNYE